MGTIYGPWREVDRSIHVKQIPASVNGFGRTVITQPLTITTVRECRHVWAQIEDQYRETEV